MACRLGKREWPRKPIVLTIDDGYRSTYTIAFPILNRLGLKATAFVALEPDEHTRSQVEGVDGFLDESQLRELSRSRISIQSHSLTHGLLQEKNDEEIRYELEESKRRLEAIVGRRVDHFCIPRASGGWRVARLIEESSYRTACGNAKGTATIRSPLLNLPRTVIERDMTISDFRRALSRCGAIQLRLIGEAKRLPSRLGGARFARALRDALYGGPLRLMFRARTLRLVLVFLGVLYGWAAASAILRLANL